ncbi:MAG: M20/M25/M40 family metallo-hydrolase [Bacteroidales bacterium]|nr:M20/M25/M40 family metallo-hydrolase [Bacteroidales bacterium]
MKSGNSIKYLASVLLIGFIHIQAFSQMEKVLVDDFRRMAMEESNVMQYAEDIAEGIGPRMTFSTKFDEAVEWAYQTLNELGLDNVQKEYWEPYGRNWELNKYSFSVTEPFPMFINSCPKAWTSGTNGEQTAELVYLKGRTKEDFEEYKGELNGKIVLITAPWPASISFDPIASRYADSTLQQMADAPKMTDEELAEEKEQHDAVMARYLPYYQLLADKIEFCTQEGALATIEPGYRQYGSVMSFSVSLPGEVKDNIDFLVSGYRSDAPSVVPQISVSLEQYATLFNMLNDGRKVVADLEIDSKVGTEPVKGMNVLGEIRGSKYPNEIVTIGAHLDSYQAGLGAADNGAGVAIMMETMRILKALDVKPARTIRIGLWGGEEQGYFGSTAYVDQHFLQGTEKHFVYFNLDNGAGLIRGVKMQNNDKAVDLMEDWFEVLDLESTKTVSLLNADMTDHIPFNDAGLPGFQFIQDNLDYFSIYHTQMDLMGRVPEEDMRQNAFIMAVLTWLAANHEGNFPQ